ncbi:uncharacterized protein LOC117323313 [Pecten maximus]|uniref:uncharacterized protein LOC117323313 n=1 Tax=Pecten maximus TaxID=6579 RepID=UPI001458AA9C|nr:uncharacterized protein LOC117323313 [Pecten maximus]
MASPAVVCGGLIAVVLLILQTIGVATPSWYVAEGAVGTSKTTIGLFKICVEVLGASQCYTYNDFVNKLDLSGNANYAIAGSVIGCILLFSSIIVAIVGCATKRPGRRTVQIMFGIWFFSSGCTIAAVVWFFLFQYEDSKTLLSLPSLVEVSLGYSFYLVSIAGGGTLIAAITLCVVACCMHVPQTVAPVTTAVGPQVFVMHSSVQQQGPAGYLQPGYSQPGYTQPGYSQPGYPQSDYSQTGYTQPGYSTNVPGYAGQPMANPPHPMQ